MHQVMLVDLQLQTHSTRPDCTRYTLTECWLMVYSLTGNSLVWSVRSARHYYHTTMGSLVMTQVAYTLRYTQDLLQVAYMGPTASIQGLSQVPYRTWLLMRYTRLTNNSALTPALPE